MASVAARDFVNYIGNIKYINNKTIISHISDLNNENIYFKSRMVN